MPWAIAVDDKAADLGAIMGGLQRLEWPARGHKWPPDPMPSAPLYSGVRVVFMDINLMGGKTVDAGSSPEAASAVFSDVLEALTSLLKPNNGPYLLVAWTEKPDLFENLVAFIHKRMSGLEAKDGSLMPLPTGAVALSKAEYIDSSGQIREQELQAAIVKAVEAVPAISGILAWESNVRDAVSEALAEVVRCVEPQQRTLSKMPKALSGVLKALAQRAVGAANVADDPTSALSESLIPVVLDRVQFRLSRDDAKSGLDWATVMPEPGQHAELNADAILRLNALHHVATHVAEAGRWTERGSVVALSGEFQADKEVFRGWFGGVPTQLALDIFFGFKGQAKGHATQEQVESALVPFLGECKWVLVETRAVCDAAQKKGSMGRYVFGLLTPSKLADGLKYAEDQAVVKTPVFLLGGKNRQIILNLRHQLALPLELTGISKLLFGESPAVLCRLRDSLVNSLAFQMSAHGSRPGIIDFEKK